MKNNEQLKLKKWADTFHPEPGSHIWQRVESRLSGASKNEKNSIFSLSVLRIAAIFVFVLVATGIITTLPFNTKNEYAMSRPVELSPLDLDDISVYYDPTRLKELKFAYAKLPQN